MGRQRTVTFTYGDGIRTPKILVNERISSLLHLRLSYSVYIIIIYTYMYIALCICIGVGAHVSLHFLLPLRTLLLVIYHLAVKLIDYTIL